MKEPVIPKKDLMRLMKRFLADDKRGISIPHFADVCGLSVAALRFVFLTSERPLTEFIQIRVSKAYRAYQKGEIAVMQNRKTEKWVEYRKTPKPALKRGYGLQFADGQIKLKIGITNRINYENPSLDEQLKENRNG
jgi:hypothetical protein